MIAEKIVHAVDEHIWITIECEGRPTISLDIVNAHGRRVLSTRIDGMGMGSQLLDVQHLDPKGTGVFERFCPFCGEEISIISSSVHVCADS